MDQTDESDLHLLTRLADRYDYRSVKTYCYDTAAGQRVEVTSGSGDLIYALRDDHIDEAIARAAALDRGTKTLSLTLKPGLPPVSAESPLTLSNFAWVRWSRIMRPSMRLSLSRSDLRLRRRSPSGVPRVLAS